MANTTHDWSAYVQAEGNLVRIRNTRQMEWKDAVTFPLDEAEDVADFMLEVVTEARRQLPEVKALVEDLEEANFTGEETLEDLAVSLFRKGYTKPSA